MATSAPAQPKIVLRDFDQVLASYGPPHETQAKCRLRGAEGRQAGPGQFAVTKAELETYREDGRREMLVQTPECIYDSALRAASSPGTLKVEAADGQFSIEGEGFLWVQTNSTLFISNHVHSVVQPELLDTSSVSPRPPELASGASPVQIFSDQFDFSGESGLSSYRGHVRVTGTNFVLTSGVLAIRLPLNERQLQDLTAQQDVHLDYETTHAEAQQMVYSAQTGVLTMTGHPWWRAEGREGSGDELALNRTNKSLLATGNAYLKTPAQNVGASELFAAGTVASTNAPGTTNQVVEVHSQSYELRPELAVFRDTVQAEFKADDQLQGRLTCGRLTATVAGTNQSAKVLAEDRVLFEQADRQLAAGQALYTASDQNLVLTQQPSWRVGAREGKGETIVLVGQTNQMTVRGNAWLRLPAGELGHLPGMAPGTASQAASQTTQPQFADVYAREYRFTPQAAHFFGQVRMEHPRMNWTCEDLDLQLAGDSAALQSLVAERAVSFNLTNDEGQKLHGTGQHSVYTSTVTAGRTNTVLRLTGEPAVLQTTNGVFENSLFILDLAQNQLIAPGRYKIHGVGPVAATNVRSPFEIRSKKR